MAETRGTRALRAAGVDFAVRSYEHREKGARFAATAIGIELERMAKTLVAEVAGDPVFVLMPGDRELSLKRLARAADVKHADLADPRDAERITGYQIGGIGPFGSRRRLPVYVDAALLAHDRIGVNAGGRGVILELDPRELVRVLQAVVAELAADEARRA